MITEKPNPSLTKDRVLSLAAKEGGVKIHPNDTQQADLLGRLKIFHLRGFLSMRREGNYLCYKLTKDIHLL